MDYELDPSLPEEDRQRVGRVLELLYSNFQSQYGNTPAKIKFTSDTEGSNGIHTVGTDTVRVGQLHRSSENILGTVLHELEHVKSEVGQKQDRGTLKRMLGIKEDESNMRQRFQESESMMDDIVKNYNLPSLDSPSTEELLATLISNQNLQKAGINTKYTPEVNRLVANYPGMQQVIDANQQRDRPTLKEAPSPNLLDVLTGYYRKLVPVRKP